MAGSPDRSPAGRPGRLGRAPVQGATKLACALGLALALGSAGDARARDRMARLPARGLPPIVFVSRAAPSGDQAGQVPGLGPHGTFAGAGGKLLEREPDGTLRTLVSDDRLFDVADPAISANGEQVAFAGRERADGPWRVWTVSRRLASEARASGESRASGELRCRTCDDAPGDDADPAWWGDTLLFVSTRAAPGRLGAANPAARGALYDGTPVTQLWAIFPDGGRAVLTHEPNGVLDPVAEPDRQRLLFSRWWFNPWRASAAGGVTRAGVGEHGSTGHVEDLPDSVNLWQVVSARLVRGVDDAPCLDELRLAAGGTVPRRGGMGVQAAPLPHGGLLAVAAHNMGLAPRPGTLALMRYGAPPSPGQRLAGAAIGDEPSDPYTEGANLRAPAACAPAPLPDGRVVCALDPGGHGDFGLWLLGAKGDGAAPLVDLPGSWELDPAPVVIARPTAPVRRAKQHDEDRQIISQPGATATFRYLNHDVFLGHGAAPRIDDARLEVYRLFGPDSVGLVRTASLTRLGRVDLRLPADTPLFELLTDPDGRPLMSAHGPAQVRGFNTGAPNATARCTGCHLGHSAKP